MRKSPPDQTEEISPALRADRMAIDALFKRIAERGRKVRAQAQSQEVGDKEQSSILPKLTLPADDHTNTKHVDE